VVLDRIIMTGERGENEVGELTWIRKGGWEQVDVGVVFVFIRRDIRVFVL
jgi:hypothetical protein